MKRFVDVKFHGPHAIVRLIAALVLVLSATGLARAHPHVLVSVEAAFMMDGKGNVTGIRHAWTFDEAYSAYAVVGLKAGRDGKVPREALADLAKTNVESLQDFLYFTALKQGKTSFEFANPTEDYYLEHDGKALKLHFVLPLKQPVRAAKTLQLEVQDDTFFVAFSFADKNPVRVEGPAPNCRVEMKLPGKSLNTGDLSKLSESFFSNLQPGFADQYASYGRLICP